MNNANNIFDRLRTGVKLETLSERDVEIINELYATGNEQIVLSSDLTDVQEQIDDAIPFAFTVVFDDAMPVINVYPDGSPDGSIPAFASGFALSSDVKLKWL